MFTNIDPNTVAQLHHVIKHGVYILYNYIYIYRYTYNFIASYRDVPRRSHKEETFCPRMEWAAAHETI